MKLIARLFLFLAVLPILSPAQFLMRPHRFAASSVTQDFDAYTAATSLASFSGWTVPDGAFITVSGGHVTSDSTGVVCIAAYEPSGFTTSANHQVEVTLNGTTGQSQGAAIAIQATGQCYHAYCEDSGTIYFGYTSAGGSSTDYLSDNIAPFTYTGTKMRMTVSGTGATRVCTAEYNKGAGWVTPSGWGNRDFGSGKRLDGGDGGISGYSSLQATSVTSITITNQ